MPKGVRDPVAVQQVAHRVRATTVLGCDDDNLTEVFWFSARPLLNELGNLAVKQLIRCYPRFEHVVADVADSDPAQDLLC